MTFEEAWPNRQIGEFLGRQVPFVGRQDLIRNKRAAGRPIDLLDAEQLEKPGGVT